MVTKSRDQDRLTEEKEIIKFSHELFSIFFERKLLYATHKLAKSVFDRCERSSAKIKSQT